MCSNLHFFSGRATQPHPVLRVLGCIFWAPACLSFSSIRSPVFRHPVFRCNASCRPTRPPPFGVFASTGGAGVLGGRGERFLNLKEIGWGLGEYAVTGSNCLRLPFHQGYNNSIFLVSDRLARLQSVICRLSITFSIICHFTKFFIL